MNIYDAHVSGSLSVSGSAEISGDLTVLGLLTANISGTITNAVTSAYAEGFLTTSSFEEFTSSYTTGSFTGSFSGDGSGLNNIPAASIVGLNLSRIASGNATASISAGAGLRINTKTEVTGALTVTGNIIGSADFTTLRNVPTLVSSSSQLTGSYDQRYVLSGSITQTTWDNIANKPDGIVSGSVQVDLTQTTNFGTLTTAISSSISDLSGSVATTTSGLSSSIGGLSSSVATTTINLSSSIGSLSSSVATTDAGQNSRLNALQTASSSLNSFTSSINTTIKSKLDSENVISGSVQVNISSTTGYSTFSSSISSSIGSLSGSVASTTLGLSSSLAQSNSDLSSSIGSLSSSVATTTHDLSASLNSFSGSIAITTNNLSDDITNLSSSLTSSLGFLSSSVVNSIFNLSSSVATTTINLSSSFNTRVTNLSSSIATTDLGQNNRLNAIETSTGSLNNFTSSIATTIKDKLNVEGVISGSIQVDITSTTGYSTFSSSISSSISSSVVALSSSVKTSITNLSSSVSSSIGSLSSSIATTTLGLSSSLDSISGSINTAIGNLSSSVATTTLNLSSSVSTSIGSLSGSVATTTSGLSSSIGSLSSSVATTTSNLSSSIGSLSSSVATTDAGQNTRLGLLETASGSLNSFTSSIATTIKNKLNTENVVSGSVQVTLTDTTGYSTFSSSISSSIGSLSGSLSASINTLSSSVATTDANQNTRLGLIETSTGSLNTFTSSIDPTIKNKLNVEGVISGSAQVNLTSVTGYSTFSSSIATTDANQNSRLNSIEGKSGSYATTGSNIFQGDQTITGSLFVSQNLIIAGSSSINFVSQSTLNIGTNIITVNAQNPNTRFGGLSVIDSGSSPLTSGSLFFDSVDNEWIFVHQFVSGAAVTSSTVITGPETINNIGNETHLTDNRVPKMISGFHIIDSSITDNGSKVSVNNNTEITGTLKITGTILSSGTSLVSGSSQIDITATTNYTTFSSSISSSISGSVSALSSSVGTAIGSLSSSVSTSIGSLSSSIATTTSNISSNVTSISSSISSSINSLSASIAATDLGQNNRLNAIETSTGSLNSFTSSINTTIDAELNAKSVVSGSSQILITATTGYSTFSSSINSSISSSVSALSSSVSSSIGSLSSSIATTDAGQNTRLGLLETSTSSLNTFTSSASTRLTALETSTGSLNTYTSSNNTVISTLQTATSSLNSFTSSINTTIDTELNTKGVISGSIQVVLTGTTGYSTFSSSISQSISSSISALSSSVGTAIGSLSSSVATTTANLSSSIGSLSSSLSASISSSISALSSSLTSSIGSLSSSISSSIGALSASIATTDGNQNTVIGTLQVATSSLNSYTSSNNTIIGTLQVATSSLNSYTSSNNTIIGTLQTATSSLNSFTSSINTTIKSKMNTDGVISGSSQVVAALPSGTISGSSQVVSSLPSGTVSGSSQIALTGTTGFGTYLNQAVLTTSGPTFGSLIVSGRAQIGGTDNRGVLTVQTGSTQTYAANTDPQDTGRFFVMENTDTSNTAGQYANITLQIAPTLSIGSGGRVLGDIRLVRTSTNSNSFFTFGAFRSDGTYKDYASIDYTGATFVGTIGASNFSGTHSGTSSGTNTGDQTTITGNAGTATTLQTARNIYGNSFNGSADVTGTIANSYLANPSFYIGVTSITLGRASGGQILSGVTIDGGAGYVTGTLLGKTGNQSIVTVSATTDWSNYAIGYSGFFSSSQTATGAASSAYGYFLKVANRDTGGGWGGIWIDYNNGDMYQGTTTVSTSYATWRKLLDASNYSTYASPLAGSTSIVTVGTITGGTWNGSSISTSYTAAKVTSVNAGTGVSVDSTTGSVTVSIGQSVATSATPTFSQITLSNTTTGIFTNGGNFAEAIRLKATASTNYPIFLRSVNPDGGGESSPWLYQEASAPWGIWHNNPINTYDFTSAGSGGISQNVGGGTNQVMVRIDPASGYVQTAAGYKNSAGTVILDNSGNTTGTAGGVAWTNVSGRPTAVSSFTNDSGYITSSSNISGSAGTLSTSDTRTIAPNSHTAGRATFGFTSWANNNTSSWADYIHLRSYTDASGGADNLVMFNKSGISMRVWQQTWNSGTAYSSYADVLMSNNYGNYSTFNQVVTASGGSSGGFLSATYSSGYNRIWAFGNATAYGLGYYQGGTDYIGFHFGSTGSPQYIFYQTGNMSISGVFTENSSIRYKKDIETVKYGLDKVLQMRGVTYVKKDTGLKEIGVIAEEMNEVVPEVIIKNEEGLVDAVSYSRLSAVFIEAIKELKQEINEQNLIISELKRKLEQ